MGKKNKNNKKRGPGRPSKIKNSRVSSLSPEIKKSIFAILILLLAGIILLSLLGVAGFLGDYLDVFFRVLFGKGSWVLVLALITFAFIILFKEDDGIRPVYSIGLGIFFVGFQGIFQIILWLLDRDFETKSESAGYIGYYIASPLNSLMGYWASFAFLFAVMLIGILVVSEISLQRFLQILADFFKFIFYRLKKKEKYFDSEAIFEQQAIAEDSSGDGEEDIEDTEDEKKSAQKSRNVFSRSTKKDSQMEILTTKGSSKRIEIPINLLEKMSEKSASSGNIEQNKESIKKALENFNIPVEMSDVSVGPTVTQYTLRPAQGVKLSQITTLSNDLALSLAAHPIRIEAPIPGKALVGIEVPNKTIASVSLREVLESKAFKDRKSNLMIPFGKNVAGKTYLADLAKMPHLLVAGATGSGKTVCLNSIIISLLYQNSFQDLKMIMVDPKRVEMNGYEGIPHLLTPVITDAKKTVNALKWAISEMENRFDLLSKVGKREIETYNSVADEKLPYIVIIIDELADLMAVSANEVEACIVRLAQMARAVGIHLIMATQRPSVNVITGLIKANIPARAAFSVASSTDSRTILDGSGAEKLLGRGDMLYVSAQLSSPVRIQGAWVSDDSICAVVDYLRDQAEPEYVDNVTEKGSGSVSFGGVSDEEDELLPEAREVIWKSDKASASLLQRRLRIGYARAARILDLLQEQGVIGESEGAKPREVLLSRADFFGEDNDGVDDGLEENKKTLETQGVDLIEEDNYDSTENNDEYDDDEDEYL